MRALIEITAAVLAIVFAGFMVHKVLHTYVKNQNQIANLDARIAASQKRLTVLQKLNARWDEEDARAAAKTETRKTSELADYEGANYIKNWSKAKPLRYNAPSEGVSHVEFLVLEDTGEFYTLYDYSYPYGMYVNERVSEITVVSLDSTERTKWGCYITDMSTDAIHENGRLYVDEKRVAPAVVTRGFGDEAFKTCTYKI